MTKSPVCTIIIFLLLFCLSIKYFKDQFFNILDFYGDTLSHLIIITYLLSSASGIAIIIITLFEYLKYRKKSVLLYFFIFFSTTLNIVINAFAYYSLINYLIFEITIFLRIIILLNNFIFLFCFPAFVLELISRIKYPKTIMLCSGNIILYPVIFLILVLAGLSSEQFFIENVFAVLIRISIGHMLLTSVVFSIILLFNMKKLENPVLKKAIRLFTLLLIVFTPGLIAQGAATVKYYYQINHLYEIFFAVTLPIFYLIWNLISFILYIYFYTFYIPGNASLLKQKINGYNLSAREEEITRFLLSGLSYKKIGESLYISVSTVKTHIANIYRKTNTKNKIELYNLLANKYK
jgi:DNA-binding CsgD family transcriptional regulator